MEQPGEDPTVRDQYRAQAIGFGITMTLQKSMLVAIPMSMDAAQLAAAFA